MKTPLYLGVDLGGTAIKAGLVDPQGHIGSEGERPTLPERGRRQVIRDMAALCLDTLDRAGLTAADVAAAGVGVPGRVDDRTGVVKWAPNLGWRDVPLAALLGEALSCPVALDNDANAAAAAEHIAGAAKGHENALVVTLGTGVGAGVVAHGRLLRGAHGLAGELGHMTLYPGGALCGCKNRGCLEMYASARALAGPGQKAVIEDPDGLIAYLAGGRPERVTAELVARCAEKGDPMALAAWDRYTSDLALGLTSAARVIDPGVIVIGGGVAQAGEFLLRPLRQKMDALRIGGAGAPGIVRARFSARAGILGAALLAAAAAGERAE